jgi:molybdenum cofactor cytidylyltransferase
MKDQPLRPVFPAALLAAGVGRRVGGPKAFLDVGGETILARVTRGCLAGGFRPLVAVLPPQLVEEARERYPEIGGILVNPDPDSGPLRSLNLALDALPETSAGVLMVLVDFVLVRPSTYRALAEAVGRDSARLWRPIHQGRHGHPVWFPADLFDSLRQAAVTEGARAVVYANQARWGAVEVDDPWIHRDLDTAEDLAHFREAAKTED